MACRMLELANNGPLLAFGGPYSNLKATRAMRAEAARLNVPADRVICTGDVVAYCAEPEETIAAIRDWGIRTIAGNCEEQLAASSTDCNCGFEEGSTCDRLAKGWYPYANSKVTADSRDWMRGLPASLTFTYGGFTFRVVHGGVERNNRFLFGSQDAVLLQEWTSANTEVVIAGHAGLPFIKRQRSGVWFNPGVIGMPANDGTADVWYGLISTDSEGALTFTTQRLAYDHHTAAATLRRSGHANGYARTLVTGLWPSLDVLPLAERAVTGKRLRSVSLALPAAGGRTAAHRQKAFTP